jgi:hypothetical protein
MCCEEMIEDANWESSLFEVVATISSWNGGGDGRDTI